MKVIKKFYCIKSKKSYNVGDEYLVDRDDISHLLEHKKENKKHPVTKKGKLKTK